MKYRRLRKTELKVSVIGVGTWQFGGEWGKNFSQREVNQMLDKAKEVGMNLIDTAECYGDHLSEALIGKYLQKDQRDLSEKYKPGAVFEQNDWRSLKNQEQLKLVEEIQSKEVSEGVHMAQWALAWCLKNPAVTCVIPGYRNAEQLESSAKAADLELMNDAHPQAWNSKINS